MLYLKMKGNKVLWMVSNLHSLTWISFFVIEWQVMDWVLLIIKLIFDIFKRYDSVENCNFRGKWLIFAM